jgi:hypothetical protein
MKKGIFRGVPAPFHAAVVFAVFFSLLSTPISKADRDVEGLWGFVAKVRAIFYETVKTTNSYESVVKGGKKPRVFSPNWDPGTDPPPPPPPPPPGP